MASPAKMQRDDFSGVAKLRRRPSPDLYVSKEHHRAPCRNPRFLPVGDSDGFGGVVQCRAAGKSLNAAHEGYDGIILIGPFNCLPFRISEAILKPVSIQQGMPLLTYESDGYPVAPAVLRQVDVHIQQILERSSKPAIHQQT